MKEITIGMEASTSVLVTNTNTAKTMKSGSLDVFATPAMCALMEEAAQAAVASALSPEEATVGIALNITHDAPSPLGATITAKAKVSAIEGRKISFDLEASDGIDIIGKGKHQRFIINTQKFMDKVNSKKKK